jgi:hypothetical protein
MYLFNTGTLKKIYRNLKVDLKVVFKSLIILYNDIYN